MVLEYYYMNVRSTQKRKDVELLEHVQRMAITVSTGLQCLSYVGRLREMENFLWIIETGLAADDTDKGCPKSETSLGSPVKMQKMKHAVPNLGERMLSVV